MKLIYFDMQGRAEFSRLLLAQAGVQYEDKRISQAEWEKLKPSKLQMTEGGKTCSILGILDSEPRTPWYPFLLTVKCGRTS